MKYICFGYYDKSKFDSMTEGEQHAMFDTCFEYDDHLRANGHWAGGEALQPPETALTLYWKSLTAAAKALKLPCGGCSPQAICQLALL